MHVRVYWLSVVFVESRSTVARHEGRPKNKDSSFEFSREASIGVKMIRGMRETGNAWVSHRLVLQSRFKL